MIVQDGPGLVIDSPTLEVVLDPVTGGFVTIRNKATGQTMIHSDNPQPWRLSAQGGGRMWFEPHPDHFHIDEPTPRTFDFDADGAAAILEWTTTDPGVAVHVRVEEDPHGGLAFWPRVSVTDGTRAPIGLTFPILSQPRRLSADPTRDQLIFPGHAGWIIRDPLEAGPLEARYPDGYAGASTQFMAYLGEGVGGFYVGSHDPHSTAKTLRFSSEGLSLGHEAWDIRRGADLDLSYPVVIDALTQGDWFEAAERYRTWVLPNAPWCREHTGNLEDETRDGSRWLFEEAGLSIWCAPARLDWAQWYRHYADLAGTPLHIVPAWDWPDSLPPTRGYEGVFPATFHPSNVESWNGHYVTPYLNDLFISIRTPDFLERWEPQLLFPYFTFPWMPFSEPTIGWVDDEVPGPDPFTTTNLDYFICPATDEQKELHAWRDRVLVEEYGVDGIFYDISSGNNTWLRCLRAEHGHTPGRGRQLVVAYETLNARSKEAVREATGKFLTQGTEVIQENVIGSIDFYVSRACAGPMGRLETDLFGPEEPPGQGRELIPLFQAVYHDVGPVHEDGWITLAEREGSLFYFVAARIALVWGGILSLQYCTEIPEEFEGRDPEIAAETILWDGARVEWTEFPTADPAKEAFVEELAAARTTFANAFLAYGKMLRPPKVPSSPIELDFHQTFYGWGAEGWHNDGSWTVPNLIVSAWQAPDGAIGVVLVNIGSESVEVPVHIDVKSLWADDRAGKEISLIGRDSSETLGRVSTDNLVDAVVAAPPHRVLVVEIEGDQ